MFASMLKYASMVVYIFIVLLYVCVPVFTYCMLLCKNASMPACKYASKNVSSILLHIR